MTPQMKRRVTWSLLFKRRRWWCKKIQEQTKSSRLFNHNFFSCMIHSRLHSRKQSIMKKTDEINSKLMKLFLTPKVCVLWCNFQTAWYYKRNSIDIVNRALMEHVEYLMWKVRQVKRMPRSSRFLFTRAKEDGDAVSFDKILLTKQNAAPQTQQ